MSSKTRRSFMKALGAGAASLPFVSMLSDSAAQEAGEELPMAFIATYARHGISAEYWNMRDTDTEDNFDISYENCILQPFDDPATYGKSFKDKIITVEGLEHMAATDAHDAAGTILTGSRISGMPANTSLDQYLAVDQGMGAETRLASAILAVGENHTDKPNGVLSYGPGGAALSRIRDPGEAFDLLFSGFVVSDDPEALAAAARDRARGQSVIDYVRADINRMVPKLAPREQQKLEQHLTSLREMEKQFEEVSVGALCTVPDAPPSFPRVNRYGGEEYFNDITNVMVDMIAQAIACDITRFVTLTMGDQSFEGNPFGFGADNHGDVAHTYDPNNHATVLNLARLNKYNFGHIARLMMRLDEFGVLDKTLIYSSSDMGDPARHRTEDSPVFLAGGANGKFRMGRRLKAPEGQISNRILVSIANAFGVDIDEYGTQPDGDAVGAMAGLV